MVNRVDVYVDGIDSEPVHAGTLEASFAGGRNLASSSFRYSSSYLAHAASYELSPDMPLTTGRIYTDESRSQFGAISDAAPDDWGRKIVEADHARRRRLDPTLPMSIGPFDLLIGVSDRTRIGALRFREGGTGTGAGTGGGAGAGTGAAAGTGAGTAPGAGAAPWLAEESGVESIHELARVVEVARRYEANEATDGDLAYLSDIATSPGGARPKANVLLSDGRLAIAKLPHSKDGTIDVERWEALALTIAGRAGIVVPQFECVAAGASTTVLVTHRFDRTAAGARLGYMSAATALGIGEYGGTTMTYADFADTIAELSEKPGEDLREMFARITLTVLINNVDDHWRNHGFLRGRAGWRLAPVFDVNPSRSRGVITSRPISSDDDPRHRQISSLLAVAENFGLSAGSAAVIVRRVAEQVATWRDVANELGIALAQIESMASAFDEEQLRFALSFDTER